MDTENILATLTPDEKRQMNALIATVNQRQLELDLLRKGLQQVWQGMATKYSLPPNFNYENETGIIRGVEDGGSGSTGQGNTDTGIEDKSESAEGSDGKSSPGDDEVGSS